MKLNKEMLDYITGDLSEEEKESFLLKIKSGQISEEDLSILEVKYLDSKIGKSEVSNSYKNAVIYAVNNRILENKSNSKIDILRYSLTFIMLALFTVLVWLEPKKNEVEFIKFSSTEKEILKLIKSDIEIIETLSNPDFLSYQGYEDNSDVYKKDIDDIKELAKNNVDYLVNNGIPEVDDQFIYDCVDEELIKKVFSKM